MKPSPQLMSILGLAMASGLSMPSLTEDSKEPPSPAEQKKASLRSQEKLAKAQSKRAKKAEKRYQAALKAAQGKNK